MGVEVRPRPREGAPGEPRLLGVVRRDLEVDPIVVAVVDHDTLQRDHLGVRGQPQAAARLEAALRDLRVQDVPAADLAGDPDPEPEQDQGSGHLAVRLDRWLSVAEVELDRDRNDRELRRHLKGDQRHATSVDQVRVRQDLINCIDGQVQAILPMQCLTPI